MAHIGGETLKKGYLWLLGKLAIKAAKCSSPSPIAIKLPENHKELAVLTREAMQREEFFRAMVENAWQVVAALSAECEILYTTASVTRVIEYTPEEVLGRIGFDFVYEEDRPRIMDLYQEVVS